MKDILAIEAQAMELTAIVARTAVDGKLPFPVGGNLVGDSIAIEIKTKTAHTATDLIVTVFVTYDETIRNVSVVPFDLIRLPQTIGEMISPLRLARLSQEAIAVYQNRITAMTGAMVQIIGQ